MKLHRTMKCNGSIFVLFCQCYCYRCYSLELSSFDPCTQMHEASRAAPTTAGRCEHREKTWTNALIFATLRAWIQNWQPDTSVCVSGTCSWVSLNVIFVILQLILIVYLNQSASLSVCSISFPSQWLFFCFKRSQYNVTCFLESRRQQLCSKGLCFSFTP